MLANVIVGEVVELPVQVTAELLTVKLAPELKLTAFAFPVVVKAVALTSAPKKPPVELTTAPFTFSVVAFATTTVPTV